MNKKKLRYLISMVIILLLFNVIVFAVPFTRTQNFWIGYAFAMVSIVAVLLAFTYTLGRDTTLKSKFYGLSLIYIAWIFLIIQLPISLIFMALPNIPMWICVIVCGLIFGVCSIGFIATDASKEEIERIDNTVKEKVFYIKSLQVDLEVLLGEASDTLLHKALKELLKTVQYSDPMSHESLSTLESKIESKTYELKEVIAGNNIEKAKAMCNKIHNLMIERNKKCKLLKQ